MEAQLTVIRASLEQMLPADRDEPRGDSTGAEPDGPVRTLDKSAAAALAREIIVAVDNNLTLATEKIEGLLTLPFAAEQMALAKKAAAFLDDFDTDEAKAELEALADSLECQE